MINVNRLMKVKSNFPVMVGKGIISKKDCDKLINEIKNANAFWHYPAKVVPYFTDRRSTISARALRQITQSRQTVVAKGQGKAEGRCRVDRSDRQVVSDARTHHGLSLIHI